MDSAAVKQTEHQVGMYVAKYDYPDQGVKAGDQFRDIAHVPINVAVAYVCAR